MAHGYQGMTTPVFSLLRLLSDGQLHSYTEVRQKLGLSPGEFSEALDDLAMAGLEFEREGSTGCKLITPCSPLDAAQIEHYLGDRAKLF